MRVSNKLPNVQLQVDKLESAGFRVGLQHVVHDLSHEYRTHGHTNVVIEHETGQNVGFGQALCSVDDNFDRTTGTRIAFRRAIADFYDTVGYKKAGAVLYPEGTS